MTNRAMACVLGVVFAAGCSGDGGTVRQEAAIVQEPARNPSGGIDRSDNPRSILMHSGEFICRRADLSIRGRRMHFAFARVYRSMKRERAGPLGNGWDANVYMRLEELPDGRIRCHPGNGRTDDYTPNGDGTFAPPPGVYTFLREEVDGTFLLRDRHGLTCLFDTLGRITSKEDRIGNRHEYLYGPNGLLATLVDEFGREVQFAYDAQDRLATITDFTGREVLFTYDGSNDLVACRSPLVTGTPNGNDFPDGKTEAYAYDGLHRMVQVIAPNEVAAALAGAQQPVPRQIMTYDDEDRVVTEMVGGTNASGVAAGGTLTFAYDLLPNDGPAGTATSTTVTDRNGNTTKYWHNTAGQCLRCVEEPNGPAYQHDWSYNAHGEITSHTRPLGNMTVFVYDEANPDRFQQGNLLSRTMLPDAARGGDQAQIVETYTYEPLYNQLRTQTAPRGNDPTYVPPNGGPNSPGRYTTTHTYDYMEAAAPPAEADAFGITIPAGLLNQGDQNGDGRTDQAMGNPVRRDRPTVNLLPDSKQAQAEGDTLQEIVDRWTYNDFGQVTAEEDPRGNTDTFAYYPENDPDGDGQDLIAGRDAATGGYLATETLDAIAGPNRLDTAPLTQIERSHAYDRRGNAISFIDGRGLEYLTVFNQLDQIVEAEAPRIDPVQVRGYLRRIEYDANDNVVAEEIENVTTDPDTCLPVLVAEHPFFRHTRVFDILDRVIEVEQDATRDGAIAASTQPETIVTRLEYDANENATRFLAPTAVSGEEPNNVVAVVYDERDLVTAVTRGAGSPEASTSTFTYDRNANRVGLQDAEDNDATPGPEAETFGFDGFDRLVEVTDRAGNRFFRTLDPGHRVTTVESQGPIDGQTQAFAVLERFHRSFDEVGRIFQHDRDIFIPAGKSPGPSVSVADGPLTPGDGRVTERFEYDESDRLVCRVEDDLATYRHSYDGANRRIRDVLPLTDPGGTENDIVFEYDRNDNIVRKTETHVSPEGVQQPVVLPTISVFDALNRLERTTDAQGETFYLKYDSRDNIVATFDQDGAVEPDPLGLFGGDINGPGNATRYAYDGINRMWQTVSELRINGLGNLPIDTTSPAIPDGMITQATEHDGNSRVVARIDSNGNATRTMFDALNRVVQVTNADGGVRTYTYDRDDHRTDVVDENGTAHTLTYDGLDRLVRHEIAPATTTIPGTGLPMLVGTTLRTFEWDGLSRLTRSFDDNEPADASDDAVVTYCWDSLSRLVEESQNGKRVGASYVADDRTDLHYPGANRSVHFTYDAHDQCTGVSNITLVNILTRRLGHDCPAIGRICSVTEPAPLQVLECTYQLDVDKRVIGSEATTNAGIVGQETLTRARDDQIIGQQLVLQNGPANRIDLDFNWDVTSINQIVGHFRTQTINGNPQQTSLRMQYGPAQEILSHANVADITGMTEFNTFNAVYERTNAPYVYNGSPGTGIRTTDANHVYQWDGLNRLRTVRLASDTTTIVATYTYDADPSVMCGRRVTKTLPGGGQTAYYYDEDHVIEERDGADVVLRQFIYGGDGADDVAALDSDTTGDGDPDTLVFYVKDGNNNVTHLVDDTGATVEFYTYDQFEGPTIFDAGMSPIPASAFGNPYMFSGRRFDPETGLYYYRARYLDPVAGEFLSRDPTGFWGDPGNDGNPMAYVGNDPWNRRDPTGLEGDDYFDPTWADLRVAAFGARILLPNASRFLEHFLSAKGTPLYLDVDDMLASMPGFKKEYERAKFVAWWGMLQQLKCCGKSPQRISLKGKYKRKGAKKWSTWGGYRALRAESYDYWLTLQGFSYKWRAWGKANREWTRGDVELWRVDIDFLFEIYDYYDFDDRYIRALVHDGKAAFFKVHGKKVERFSKWKHCFCHCPRVRRHSGSVDPIGGR